MFEFEEVKESEARAFAKENGAVFKLVSAKNAKGIEVIIKHLISLFRTYFSLLESFWSILSLKTIVSAEVPTSAALEKTQ
jgi:hypothetical protein